MQKSPRPVDHVVDVESHLGHNYFARRRRPEMIQSDDIAGSTYPFVPAKSRASFNCQRGDVEGQKCISVLGGLFCKQLPRWHRLRHGLLCLI